MMLIRPTQHYATAANEKAHLTLVMGPAPIDALSLPLTQERDQRAAEEVTLAAGDDAARVLPTVLVDAGSTLSAYAIWAAVQVHHYIGQRATYRLLYTSCTFLSSQEGMPASIDFLNPLCQSAHSSGPPAFPALPSLGIFALAGVKAVTVFALLRSQSRSSSVSAGKSRFHVRPFDFLIFSHAMHFILLFRSVIIPAAKAMVSTGGTVTETMSTQLRLVSEAFAFVARNLWGFGLVWALWCLWRCWDRPAEESASRVKEHRDVEKDAGQLIDIAEA